MTMYKGTTPINVAKFGTVAADRVYYGTNLVYTPSLPTLAVSVQPRYWFMADRDVYSDAAATTRCFDNGLVYNWLNQGGAPDWAVQATSARRLTFKTGGLNGKPFLRANYTTSPRFQDLVGGDQPLGSSNFDPYHVFVVVNNLRANRIAAASATTSAIFGPTGTTGFRKNLIGFSGATSNTASWFKTEVQAAVGTGPQVLVMGKAAVEANLFRFGSQSVSPATFTQTGTAAPGSTAGMAFLNQFGSNPFDGDIYEVLYFNAELSNTEALSVVNLLKAKYGIA